MNGGIHHTLEGTMLKQSFITLSFILFTLTTSALAASPSPTVTVVMETTLGPITLELDRQRAPITVGNFIAYARSGFYNGTIFHRVMPGFMVQGGGFTTNLMEKATRPPIKNEAHNGLSNRRGTIAMARTDFPDSATSQFFINVVDNLPLDPGKYTASGYAVFGHVIAGMDVVDRIAATPTTFRNQLFANLPVKTISITRVTIREK
jgi:peptidyl-prolyl cis-trans isomerase A (cyclophilin A)